jgi:hypothetical protein
VAVMRLDDLDVVAFAQRPCGHVEQLEDDVDAGAHVGRHHDRHILRDARDLILLLGR